MLASPVAVWRFLPVVVIAVAGCSGEITERTLVGTWRATGSGTGTAFKIKSESPEVRGSDALAAGKLLSTTALEIKDGGLFSLSYGAKTYDGSWKFDKEAGFVELDAKTVDGEPADPKETLFSAFLGIVDQKTRTMKLFPGSRNSYQELKQKGDKGADLLNVKLRKE
jgi:hypothetical protein